ncbi:MAG: hypothetical protein EOP48_32140 [Sphingobacteriales bacterium]|nr:MAG: hypothetical protein EOP48_32140 [Sphingobacteriales bacterium]
MQQTNQTSNGSKIKDAINFQTKDYFDWMNEVEEAEKKSALNKLVGLIEQYRQIEFLARYRNGGYESLDEQVYFLLGSNEWFDNLTGYRYECQHMLKMLATPSLHQAIAKEGYSIAGMAQMIESLLEFFITLDTHPYQTLLLSRDIQSYPSNYKTENIEELTVEYEERVRVAASGKIKNIY